MEFYSGIIFFSGDFNVLELYALDGIIDKKFYNFMNCRLTQLNFAEKFSIKKCIGKGAFSKVYKGQNIVDGGN